MGHPTVVFTEPQIHAILRTISTEIVQSSVHVMMALLMHAARGGPHKLGQFLKTVQRTAAANWTLSDSSDGGQTQRTTLLTAIQGGASFG